MERRAPCDAVHARARQAWPACPHTRHAVRACLPHGASARQPGERARKMLSAGPGTQQGASTPDCTTVSLFSGCGRHWDSRGWTGITQHPAPPGRAEGLHACQSDERRHRDPRGRKAHASLCATAGQAAATLTAFHSQRRGGCLNPQPAPRPHGVANGRTVPHCFSGACTGAATSLAAHKHFPRVTKRSRPTPNVSLTNACETARLGLTAGWEGNQAVKWANRS